MDTAIRNAFMDSIEYVLAPLEDREMSKMTVIAISREHFGPTREGVEFIEDAMSRLEETWAIQDA